MRISFLKITSCFALLVMGFIFNPGSLSMAQKCVKPLKRSLLLSGSFGEIRSSHLHSGIDIKTGGVQGLPVLAVQYGIVSRVVVSPVGYGLALYVDHPDGTTSVYGHLQRFAPQVAKVVHEMQYQNQSYRIDENILDRQIYFDQGEIIGYSGNSGSSAGPHLHFEIRNTETEHTLNPLSYLSIYDKRAPLLQSLLLYRITDDGEVRLLSSNALNASETGAFPFKCYTVPVGNVAIGLHMTDRMNNSSNALGVYRIDVTAGQDTIYHLSMDSCSFDQTRLVNDLKDFDEFKRRRTVYRCFGNYQKEMLAVSMRGNGSVYVPQDSVVKLRVRVADINGNSRILNFALKGGEPHKEDADRACLRYGMPHDVAIKNWKVKLHERSLFSSVPDQVAVKEHASSSYGMLVLSEKEVPLNEKADLRLIGQFAAKTVICELSANGRKYPLPTEWSEQGLACKIGSLSRYIISQDTIAPTLTYQGKTGTTYISFKTSDNLSGVYSYTGTVNGEWCIFAYDPRTGILKCRLDEYVFKSGIENVVEMRVEDAVGNSKKMVVKVRK